MRIVFVVGVLVVATSVFGQAEPPNKREVKEVKSSSAPVTHAEAKAVFDKAWKALVTGLKIKGSNPARVSSDKNPITKNEVLAAFQTFETASRPMFKRSASKVKFDQKRLRKDLDPTVIRLIEQGFVMPVGPLVIGKNGPVSTYEFGDAVGVVLLRIADLTHMPRRKFTPSLMPPG